jgi:hypothetical protein
VIATALLHYGSHVRIRLDDTAAQRAVEAIAAHATRGGWVTIADVDGQHWSLLVSAGIPIWISVG